jgi:hypothetical protein
MSFLRIQLVFLFRAWFFPLDFDLAEAISHTFYCFFGQCLLADGTFAPGDLLANMEGAKAPTHPNSLLKDLTVRISAGSLEIQPAINLSMPY